MRVQSFTLFLFITTWNFLFISQRKRNGTYSTETMVLKCIRKVSGKTRKKTEKIELPITKTDIFQENCLECKSIDKKGFVNDKFYLEYKKSAHYYSYEKDRKQK